MTLSLDIWIYFAGKENEGGANDIDEIDLENFGKKKKKKKKPFNLDEMENNLPAGESTNDAAGDAANEVAGDEGGNVENDYDVDLDFSKSRKKKKKKKDLDELVAEKTEEQQPIQSENGKYGLVIRFVFELKICRNNNCNA